VATVYTSVMTMNCCHGNLGVNKASPEQLQFVMLMLWWIHFHGNIAL